MGNEGAYLRGDGAVEKDIFERHVKLAHVVFAEAIFVPADHLKQEAVEAANGQVDELVPFRVQRFGNGNGGASRISEGQDEILRRRRSCQHWRSPSTGQNDKEKARTGSLKPLLSFAARFLA